MSQETETGEKVRAAGAGSHHKRFGQQIDGGWNIAIYDHKDGDLIAQIVTTLPNGPTIHPASDKFGSNDNPPQSTEMWWYQSSLLDKLTGTTIYIESNPITGDSVNLLRASFDPATPAFTSAEGTSWAPLRVENGVPNVLVFCGKDQYNGGDKDLYVSIVVTNEAITQVEWFEKSDSAPAYIVPATASWTSSVLPNGQYQAAYSLHGPNPRRNS
ncbi:hypothetical protein [Polyangium mundeleinium]|uniref:Uncharacterized protein n=1 Tax=Polyangium mundeleinium TaxID=2995306 RepID=A0ABT5EP16_9BACT|nr:hypothetical protein [Polyangium mundeleinium]MDC0743588.1 hypothetical protein [Polyangium mundeleinium]